MVLRLRNQTCFVFQSEPQSCCRCWRLVLQLQCIVILSVVGTSRQLFCPQAGKQRVLLYIYVYIYIYVCMHACESQDWLIMMAGLSDQIVDWITVCRRCPHVWPLHVQCSATDDGGTAVGEGGGGRGVGGGGYSGYQMLHYSVSSA